MIYSSLGCVNPDFKGDGECDDENNNAGCEYDGGDCCGYDVVTIACTVCQCLDPNNGGTGCSQGGTSQGMKTLK